MKKICRMLLLVSLGITLIAGCSKHLSDSRSGKSHLTLAAAGIGGTYYSMGGAISSLINQTMNDINIDVQTSGGSAQNIRLIQSGEADMAWANGSEIYWARNAQKFFEGQKLDKFRIAAFGWHNTYHFAALENSKISNANDFEGKKVGIGPQGSGAAIFGEVYLKHIGMWEKISPRFLPPNDQLTALKDRNLDVFGYFSGLPMAALNEMGAAHDIKILDIAWNDEATGFTEKFPFYNVGVIPAHTYKGQRKAIKAYENYTYLIVKEDMPQEMLYRLLRTIYSEDGQKYLNGVHQASKHLTVKNALKGIHELGADMHPGAVEFFKEQGLSIDE